MTAKEPKLYADKGEWVRCENGHQICKAARVIHFGDLQNPQEDWTDWQQPEPAIGTLAKNIKCSVCGARWYSDHGLFHFADGWRSE